MSILEATIWLIRKARFLLLAFLVMAILTPIVLYLSVSIDPLECVVIAFQVAMGNSPLDFEQLTENQLGMSKALYMTWLFALQFLSWAFIPIVTGVIVDEGVQEIERRQERLARMKTRKAEELVYIIKSRYPAISEREATRRAERMLERRSQKIASSASAQLNNRPGRDRWLKNIFRR